MYFMSYDLISVIMPVYNTEKYLKESIESIINQSYKNFEFIIINDGSTDKSLDIINEYARKDNRIVVISRKNKGLTYSLNEGISLANGEFIARMDSDDISMPERFEKQLNYFYDNNELDIVGSCANLIGDKDLLKDEKDNYSWVNINFKLNEDIEGVFLKECAIPHPSVMMKKTFLKKIGGYFEYTTEDYNLWLRAIKNGYRIGKLKEKLISYRIHNNSLMRSNLPKIAESNALNRIMYIKNKYINENENFNYIIWGAGNGGKIAYDSICKVFKNGVLVGVVDKFKSGKWEGINIIRPEDILSIKFKYIFIATTPGKIEAERFLSNNGYIYKQQYIFLV